MGYDFEQLKQQNDIVDVIGRKVQLTKRGAEHKGICPFHDDTKASLQVNERKQVFACFACGKHGDVFDFLLAYGYTHREAAEELHGGPLDKPAPERKALLKRKPQIKWQQVTPGEEAPLPEFDHYRHGKPSNIWEYRNAGDSPIGYVCRFDTPEGKEVVPLTYATDGSRYEWRWQGFQNPRPIYGLDRLAAAPDKTVIISEGEKTADAITELIPTSVSVAWPGGANAIQHVDWQALHGRKVILWPDNDVPGIKAMQAIAALLQDYCPVIKYVHNPEDAPKGWDAADAEWTPEEARRYVLQNMHDTPQQPQGEPEPEPDPEPPAPEDTPEPPQDDPPEDTEPKKRDVYENQHFRYLGIEPGDGSTGYWFYSKGSKSIVKMSAAGMTKQNLIDIAPLNYWEGEYANKDKFDAAMAANALIGISQAVGVFDKSIIRGRGAWSDDSRTIVHAGTHLIVDGKKTRFEDIRTSYVYQVGKHLGFNTENPLPAEEASKIMHVLEMCNFKRPVSAQLLAGWCVVAPICGALKWRPHIWLQGPSGAGKSWVTQNIVSSLLGKTALRIQGESTEAGIRQYLSIDALPVVYDEAEGETKKDRDRVQSILNLMRSASTDDGGNLIKGSAAGDSVEYVVRSCFCFASIGMTATQTSDRSRITVIDLEAVDQEDKDARFEELERRLGNTITRDFVERLHARTVSMLPVILKNARTFSNAVSVVLGNRRSGDQLGALLAGAYSLYKDTEVSYESAVKWVKGQDWEEERSVTDIKDEMRLFNRIMEEKIRLDTLQTRTVGELALIACASRGTEMDIMPEYANSALKRVGIKVQGSQLMISNTAEGVRRMLENTPWERNYHKILLRIKGAEASGPIRFGSGILTRSVGVPLSLLQE